VRSKSKPNVWHDFLLLSFSNQGTSSGKIKALKPYRTFNSCEFKRLNSIGSEINKADSKGKLSQNKMDWNLKYRT